MATALGKLLILQMNARDAGSLELAHGSLYVEGLAETGVGVAQEGQSSRLSHRARFVDELRQA